MQLRQTQIVKSLYFLCFVGACILIARFCHTQTRGFALNKITNNFPLEKRESPSSPISTEIFKQKFHFLGRGFQSFVFISEDEQYVLKFFSNRYHKKITYCSLLSYLPLLKNWALAQKALFQEKLNNSFTSYQLALDEMADKTALLYLHLHPTTDLPSRITLIDPLHIAHQIDPNQFAFLIQKKVNLAYPTLQQWIKLGRYDLAKQAISSLIQLFTFKWQHSIADSDPLIRTNYGFIGTQAIQIDVGPLSKQKAPEKKEIFVKEMIRITASLKHWLEENAPELLPHLEQELATSLEAQDPITIVF